LPLYEYQCKVCAHRFEVIQKFSDKPVNKCPKCGKQVVRLLSSPAVQFKGTGWYVTDYAKRSGPSDGKPEAKTEKEPAKESAPAAEDKSGKAKQALGASKPPASK
jgi:putative FmdB family regulatory protein